MPQATLRPVLPGTRIQFRVFAVAVLLAVTQLYVFPADTDRYFAWTVQPPLSAAFMGAGFGAGCVLVASMWNQTVWARVRLSFLTVFVFTVVTLGATLIHLDKFHFGESGASGFAAWLWLVVYIAVPVAMAVLLALQERTPGGDPAVSAPLPRWMPVLLAVVGVVGIVVGGVLFVVPGATAGIWPWTISPLVARAFAAWLVALGFAAVLAIGERDLQRLRVPSGAYLAFAVLVGGALIRFSGTVEWGRPSAWLLVAWLAALGFIGVYGLTAPRRAT
jgi:hypothetical protein